MYYAKIFSLEAAILRGDHIAKDPPENRVWTFHRYQSWRDGTYALLDGALGPGVAYEFAGAGSPAGNNFQQETAMKVAYLGGLVDRLASLPLMGDWKP